MMIGRYRFNIYFVLAAAAGLVAGCAAIHKHEEKAGKIGPVSTLRLHLEATPYFPSDTEEAQIVRDSPVTLTVEKTPFITEADLDSARLLTVPALGGYDIQLKLRQHGTWVLEQITTENVGKHVAILCQFGDKIKEARWLGAIKIPKRISDGTITFTPDASKAELDVILAGWTNTIKQVNKANE